MKLSDLNENIGYISLTYPDGKGFYVKTSFDINLCPEPETDCVYDMLSHKNIHKRYFEHGRYSVSADEPVHLREESDFLKQFM